MKKLLIIDKHQFGYLTDSYKWCQYLKDKFDITVVCLDIGKKKIPLNGIKIKYIKGSNIKALKGFIYILFCLWYIFLFKGKIIVIYFEYCKLLKQIFFWKPMLLDIRTLSVSQDIKARIKNDKKRIATCKLYDTISVISEGIKQKINLPYKNIFILPLGADVISNKIKNFQAINLLYVGTLNNRNIEKTIEGFFLFKKKYPFIDISYDIIGDGNNNELDYLNDIINKYKLSQFIILHGRIPYTQLEYFFSKCNIGVSFVPLTEYYNYQPPTKTFEYILSGLYTIATVTYANKELINEDNGILIKDTADDFANALYSISLKIDSINENAIRNSLKEYSWKNIVNKHLCSILSSLP